MAFGIDVSSYQAPDGALLDGMSFCIIKATEGTGYINPNRAQWHAVARSRGVTTGAYHFMRGGDAGSQADYFLAHLPGDVDWLALDVEDAGDGLSWAGRVGFILAWTDRAKATGKPTLVYASRSWANALWGAASSDERARLAQLPLWVADYTRRPGEYSGPWPGGWPIAMHQYTSAPIDKNVLLTDDLQGGDDMQLTDIVKWPSELGEHEVPLSTLLSYLDKRAADTQTQVDKIASVIFGSGIDRPYADVNGDPLPATDVGNVARWTTQQHMETIAAVKALGEQVTHLSELVADRPASNDGDTDLAAAIKDLTGRVERLEAKVTA